jgi:uncharacterized SAM-binding protein YcdF (DUF218 family)
MDEDTLYRCFHAADLYHQGEGCPVLVSGGKVDPQSPQPACAVLMRDFLVQLGVRPADLIVEDASRTTYENAVECRKVLDSRHIRQVVLITDAVDMLRAEGCFRQQGLEVTPSPCRYRAVHWGSTLLDTLPEPNAARNCQRAWHECLGEVWYWIQGRI